MTGDHERSLSRRDTARLVAAVDQIGRTGARNYEVAYQEPDVGPVTWTATATFRGTKRWQTAGDPVTATELLLEDLIDGGMCTTCGRPTAVVLDGQRPLSLPTICERTRLGNKYLRSCS